MMKEIYGKLKAHVEIDLEEIKEEVSSLANEKRELERLTND